MTGGLRSAAAPVVLVSSYPPRLCSIGNMTEQLREFTLRLDPHRDVLVVSHTDARGADVIPIIDVGDRGWWKPVVDKIAELRPYVVHIQHDYQLYEHVRSGVGDGNAGFLSLLEHIRQYPTVIDLHTIHYRLTDAEAEFLRRACELTDVVTVKYDFLVNELEWAFVGRGWPSPRNIMVVPYGVRPDRRWLVDDVPALMKELGLPPGHFAGLVGWIEANRPFDLALSMWEDVAREILQRTGQEYMLLIAGSLRDPKDLDLFQGYMSSMRSLEDKGLLCFHEFVPRGDLYYKYAAVCDLLMLPSTEDRQFDALATAIAVQKPILTAAPVVGMTLAVLESEGGLLYTDPRSFRERLITLAADEKLRMVLSMNLGRYLDGVVSWDLVTQQYSQAYELARKAKRLGQLVEMTKVFLGGRRKADRIQKVKEVNGVFVCYSHADKPFVRRLVRDLEGAGIDLWIDERQLLPGDSLNSCIQDAIYNSAYVMVVLSPDSIKSSWVRKELNAAFELEGRGDEVFLVPVIASRCDLPLFLWDRYYIDLTVDYDAGVAQLIKRFQN